MRTQLRGLMCPRPSVLAKSGPEVVYRGQEREVWVTPEGLWSKSSDYVPRTAGSLQVALKGSAESDLWSRELP